MSILGVDARKKIAELIKQIQEQSGGFGPPSAGYGDGKLYNGPEPVVGNAIKKVATFKPEIPFGTDIARKVVEGTENLGNQLVPPLELGPVKLTGSEQLDILLSGLLQKQKGEVEVPAAKKKAKVREPELSPVPTTVPKYKGPKLEDIEAEITPASDVKSFVDDFLSKYQGGREDATATEVGEPGKIYTVENPPPPHGELTKQELGDAVLENWRSNKIAELYKKLDSGKITREQFNIEEADIKDQLQILKEKWVDTQPNTYRDGTEIDYRIKSRDLGGPIPSTVPPKAPTAPGTTVPKYKGPKLEDVDPELAGKNPYSKYNEFLSQFSDQPQVNLASPTGKAALQEFDALVKKYKAALNGGSIGYAEYNQLMEEAYQKYRQG